MDPNAVVLEISSDDDEKETNSNGGLKSSRVDLYDDDDCVVLDKDPNASADVKNGGLSNRDDDDDEIVVVSEKGQVACRDYPHSRHLCIKFPFSTTPNHNHCNQCYCYVCDSLAPCVFWGNGSSSADHCRATDKDEFWKRERKNVKNGGNGKAAQLVSQLSPVDLYTQAPVMVQLANQIPKRGPIHANLTSANFQSADIISQYRDSILASRNKLRPNFASQLAHRVQQRYNVGSRVPVQRPVFKRTNPVRGAITNNQNRYNPYRGNIGNPVRQQNYQVNGMLSGSSEYLGSLQPNAVNASVPYPPQSRSQTYTSSTVNQHQPQSSYHSNPNFQSRVNSNPIPENPLYNQLRNVPVLQSSRPQPASSQQTHMAPGQQSYHVPSKTQVDSPLVPVSDITQNALQGNKSQGSIVDSGFKDYGLGLPTGQDSATLGGAGSAANESTLTAVSSGLADYQFDDWLFDNQPIETGFTDYSSDSAFIDTGPIFQF
ncbi:hypothetical protein Hdeb2414_s0007g00229561 [Helianthus debilis subsp. tardiflorus]